VRRRRRYRLGVFSRALTVRIALGAAAALGLSIVATSAIESSRSEHAAPHGPRPDVLVVGESLTRQVAGLESQLLRADGYRAVIAARDSEDLGSPFVQAQVSQAAAEGVPVVVLETASNDAYHGAGTAPPDEWAPALDRYRRTLDATLQRLTHQCTVLVDTRVDQTSSWYGMSRIGPGIDTALADAAKAHPRSVVLVRWSALSAGHGSDWFWSDGLHFGDPSHGNADWHAAGANAFAQAIASGVQSCETASRR